MKWVAVSDLDCRFILTRECVMSNKKGAALLQIVRTCRHLSPLFGLSVSRISENVWIPAASSSPIDKQLKIH